MSEPPYDTLDFALLRDPARLAENQRRLAEAVGFDPGRLYQARQVHGRALVVAGGEPARVADLEADALVAEPGSRDAVAVRVADCVPVLVADPASGRVAAIHAGWRGVVAGVVSATISHMVAGVGAGPAAGFVAAIGPCIGPCCFEVGADVAAQIAAASVPGVVVGSEPEDSRACMNAFTGAREFGPGAGRRNSNEIKVFVDLRMAVRAQLAAAGLADGAIDDVPAQGASGCTRCDAARFYSFRRDGDASGRLIAVIVAGG